MKFLILLLLFPAGAMAQTVTPQFTQGSMQATTTTTQTITETIATEVYGQPPRKPSPKLSQLKCTVVHTHHGLEQT